MSERSFADKAESGCACLCAFLPVLGIFGSAGIGLFVGLVEILEYLKTGNKQQRKALEWIESDLGINVTWIGLREILSNFPLWLFILIAGPILFGIIGRILNHIFKEIT